MGLLDRLTRRTNAWDGVEATYERMNVLDWMTQFQAYSYGGNSYVLPVQQTWDIRKSESLPGDFNGAVQGAYKQNGIVFAAIHARAMLFSEARFVWRNKTTRKTFGNAELAVLEHPDVNVTTGEFMYRMEQDASLAGNWYGVRDGKRILRLRPDWVDIVVGSYRSADEPGWEADAYVLGYVYWPGGKNSGAVPIDFAADEIAHWSPIPDPSANFRGMSWLTPILTEIQADNQGTTFKQKFFDNAATPNLAVVMSDEVRNEEQFRMAREAIEASHTGAERAFKTLYLMAGADVKVVGTNFRDMGFDVVQAGGEARIAVASRVPAAILGIKEGLAGSSLNAGNLGVARRLFADGWARPTWRSACACLEKFVNVPDSNTELWYDDSNIPFLREDATDAAQILNIQAEAIGSLTDRGFEPSSVVTAVTGGDLGQLVHTGLLSVQLQPPGSGAEPTGTSSATTGPVTL